MVESVTPQAWISLPSDEELRAKSPPGRTGAYNFGFVTGMSKLLRVHERIGPAFLRLFTEVMFAPGALSRAEREMVAAVTAAAQDCHY